ncbi:hypothetical protein XB02_19180, partial [Pantoea ananatis]
MNNATRSWSGLRKNILVKLALSFSDLIALNLALFLSAATVQGIWGDLDAFIPPHQIENRFIAQFIMSVLCTGWFWM